MELDQLSSSDLKNRQLVPDDAIESVDRSLDRHGKRFWASHIRLGNAVLTGGSLFALAYFTATPDGSHRPALLTVSSLSLIVAVGTLLFVDRVAVYPWRVTFSFASTLAAGAALTACIYLDGGLHSPLIIFMVLPIMSAALALPTREVMICGMAGLVEFGLVAFTDSSAGSTTSEVAALSALLAGTIALSMGAARYRSRFEVQEDRLLQELQRKVHTDSLTGCLNQGTFYERLDIEISSALRHGQSLSLLLADIDLFKSFNDSHGHAEGDAALAKIGAVMRTTSRSGDTVARVGGDEFAVILPMTDVASASALADRMASVVDHLQGSEFSVSIGFAALDPLAPTSKKLFRDADLGLYRAKANGRGCVATISNIGDGPPRYVQHGQELADRVLEQADWDRLEESLRESNRATSEVSSLIDSLQSTMSVGFGHVDREFRFLRINSMLASVHGGKAEDQVGRTVAEVVPAMWPMIEPMYQRVIETGEPVVWQEVSGIPATDPDHIHYWLTNLNPVKVNDRVTGIAIVVIDITDRKRLEQSQATLSRAVVGALSASVEMRIPIPLDIKTEWHNLRPQWPRTSA